MVRHFTREVWRSTGVLLFCVLLAACPLPTSPPDGDKSQPPAVSWNAASCVLSGVPNAGEVWTAHFAGADRVCTVETGDTLSDVAGSLAEQLDALDGAIAGTETETFWCVDLGVDPPDLVLSVASPASAVIDTVTALTAMVELGGTPETGREWRIDINADLFSYTVQDGDSLFDVAASLADSIDVEPKYLGTAVGTTVVVTSILGGEFEVTATAPVGGSATVDEATARTKSVVLSGPCFAGETWSIEADGVVAEYVVQEGDTVADVALALAGQIESLTMLIVGSEGERVVITDGTGADFNLAAAVTPSGAGTVDTATPTAVLLTLVGPVAAGETWTIRLNGVEYPCLVQPGDTAEELAAALAAMVDGAAGCVAGSESLTIAIASLAGGAIDAALEVTVP